MQRELPVWRSLMYVPVNVDKYVEKAHTRGADVIQLDLEDSVPPAEKERARTLVEKAAARTWSCASTARFRWPCAISSTRSS
ncbi:MAG: aldolase/citrate lyase family protein, partial [Burkholderiales bacterium]